jgi:hypothetical protein
MAVLCTQPFKRATKATAKIIFLLITVNKNPIHLKIQLKGELKTFIFILNLTKLIGRFKDQMFYKA